METTPITPNDIANFMCNVPGKLQDYSLALPPGLIIAIVFGLKNRMIQKKELFKVMEEGKQIWLEEKAEAKRKLDFVENFEPGQMKVCHCEYWEGKIVEVVKTEMTEWGYHHVHIKHNDVVYHYFRTEWLSDT